MKIFNTFTVQEKCSTSNYLALKLKLKAELLDSQTKRIENGKINLKIYWLIGNLRLSGIGNQKMQMLEAGKANRNHFGLH